MAYTTINKSTDYFNTKLYTGTGSTNAQTGIGFQPDWVWIQNRGGTYANIVFDAVRGATKLLEPQGTGAQATVADTLTSFDSDGFTLGADSSNYCNRSSSPNTYVGWNWLAGGASPSQTYTVKVVSDSGNKYRFDDFGTSAVTLDLQEGGTYTFDQSDSSNAGHPLRFSTTSNGTHGGGSEYTTGVTTSGTPGSSGAYTRITVASGAATLYYYCTQHSGMGGQANTNSTYGSSNFSGNTQSTVSANTTSGLSIVKYTGNESGARTIGHGLGAVPKMIIIKRLNDSINWGVYHKSLGNTKVIFLNTTDTTTTSSAYWNDTTPTSSVFTVNSNHTVNHTGSGFIAYCFTEKEGFSKFGDYTGNASTDGTFVYTGFKPAFVIVKNTSATANWVMTDNKISFNGKGTNDSSVLFPSSTAAENDGYGLQLYSNGFAFKGSDSASATVNGSGNIYLYMAFAEAPLVGTNNIPATAR